MKIELQCNGLSDAHGLYSHESHTTNILVAGSSSFLKFNGFCHLKSGHYAFVIYCKAISSNAKLYLLMG